jgi:hypothetical protein
VSFKSSSFRASGKVSRYQSSLLGVPKTIAWRIFGTALGGGTAMSIAEIEFRAYAGGPNLCSGGTPTASTSFSGTFSADKAFDGNAATSWSASSNSNVNQTWIRYDLPSAAAVMEVSMTARTGGAQNQMPTEFYLQCSLDGGTTWLNSWRVTTGSWASGETKVFTRTW